MSVTASQVKDLREKTGVGMMDCKKALVETNGDFEKAISYLREKGLSKASKKADRTTNEGQVFISLSNDRSHGIILEISCETDFVARNDRFHAFGQSIASFLLNQPNVNSVDDLNTLDCDGQLFESYVSQYVVELGENLSVTRFSRFNEGHYLSSYIHMNGKIGTVVSFSTSVEDEVSKGIAMQVAATSPLGISSDDISKETLENERNVIRQQVLNEGKPEAIVDKIVDGKLNKYFKEVCLLDQQYVKNTDQSIRDLLPKDITITQFVRYSIG